MLWSKRYQRNRGTWLIGFYLNRNFFHITVVSCLVRLSPPICLSQLGNVWFKGVAVGVEGAVTYSQLTLLGVSFFLNRDKLWRCVPSKFKLRLCLYLCNFYIKRKTDRELIFLQVVLLFSVGNDIGKIEGLEGLLELRELVLDRNKIKVIIFENRTWCILYYSIAWRNQRLFPWKTIFLTCASFGGKHFRNCSKLFQQSRYLHQ